MSEILSTEKFLIQEMTWPEVKEALKVTEMAIAPVSSTEQHGPHCQLNTDALIGFEIACRAVRKLHSETGKRVLIAPKIGRASCRERV